MTPAEHKAAIAVHKELRRRSKECANNLAWLCGFLFVLGVASTIGAWLYRGAIQTGRFCGQMSCSALKEIVIRPGYPVPIADMDCKCSRWDEVRVEE